MITIASLDVEAAIPFNLPVVGLNINGTTNANPILQNYLVAQDGTIEMPQLGKVKVAGLTRLQLIDKIKRRLPHS